MKNKLKQLSEWLEEEDRENWEIEVYVEDLLKEREEEIMKDLDLRIIRVGHQIKIHKGWLLEQPEKEIIRFVQAMAERYFPEKKK